MFIPSYIKQYQNGNVTVTFNTKDGTKERFTNDDEFHPDFAESIDVCITYKCNGNCQHCYADCTIYGEHADLLSPYVKNVFIPSLKPYTELALNGNDLTHPQLREFLNLLKEHKIIANLTVNQKHFMQGVFFLEELYKENLIHGLGVSLNDSSESGFISGLRKFPNSVVHTIAGILTQDDIQNLADHDLKLLILGYKNKGRGGDYFSHNQSKISENIYKLRESIPSLLKGDLFNIVSFDNLATEQLNLKSYVSNEDWERYYMGDDGSFTFFVDLVEMKYARDSMTPDTHYIDNKDAVQMFNDIRR